VTNQILVNIDVVMIDDICKKRSQHHLAIIY